MLTILYKFKIEMKNTIIIKEKIILPFSTILPYSMACEPKMNAISFENDDDTKTRHGLTCCTPAHGVLCLSMANLQHSFF